MLRFDSLVHPAPRDLTCRLQQTEDLLQRPERAAQLQEQMEDGLVAGQTLVGEDQAVRPAGAILQVQAGQHRRGCQTSGHHGNGQQTRPNNLPRLCRRGCHSIYRSGLFKTLFSDTQKNIYYTDIPELMNARFGDIELNLEEAGSLSKKSSRWAVFTQPGITETLAPSPPDPLFAPVASFEPRPAQKTELARCLMAHTGPSITGSRVNQPLSPGAPTQPRKTLLLHTIHFFSQHGTVRALRTPPRPTLQPCPPPPPPHSQALSSTSGTVLTAKLSRSARGWSPHTEALRASLSTEFSVAGLSSW